MGKYYIANLVGSSGICKYSRDFYELVLKPLGYSTVNPDTDIDEIKRMVEASATVHIETGVNQKRELQILRELLSSGYRKVDITMHDTPYLRWPLLPGKGLFFGNLAKVMSLLAQWLGVLGFQTRRVRRIFVLNERARKYLLRSGFRHEVVTLPHILNPDEVRTDTSLTKNLIFFGFVGKGKGLDYALELHERLLAKFPEMQMLVVGSALGHESYFERLKRRFVRNVHYLGHVEEIKLRDVFDQASFAILPFRPYRFLFPTSGSVLTSLKMGKVVLTTDVNSVGELIQDGVTGKFLSGDLNSDYGMVSRLIDDEQLVRDIRQNVSELLPRYTDGVSIGRLLGVENL